MMMVQSVSTRFIENVCNSSIPENRNTPRPQISQETEIHLNQRHILSKEVLVRKV